MGKLFLYKGAEILSYLWVYLKQFKNCWLWTSEKHVDYQTHFSGSCNSTAVTGLISESPSNKQSNLKGCHLESNKGNDSTEQEYLLVFRYQLGTLSLYFQAESCTSEKVHLR